MPAPLGDRLRGVLAPAVTPFDDAGGAPARDACARNVRAHLAAGLAGVLVAGSSGEAALLDDDERARLVASARELVPGRPLADRRRGRRVDARDHPARAVAADAGADAVLVVSPHYYGRRMTEAALLAHFGAVADASPVPVLLYNIPVYAHLVLSPAFVARMARHPNVIGMKDSAGDLPTLERYLDAQGSRLPRAHRARRHLRAGARERGVGGDPRRVAVRAGARGGRVRGRARRRRGGRAGRCRSGWCRWRATSWRRSDRRGSRRR
jgi:4-hydroxy-2-oxoglutarate aldolase